MENTCNQGGAKAFLKSYCRHFNLCALSGLQLYTKIFSNWFQLSFTVTLTVRVIVRYEWGLLESMVNHGMKNFKMYLIFGCFTYSNHFWYIWLVARQQLCHLIVVFLSARSSLWFTHLLLIFCWERKSSEDLIGTMLTFRLNEKGKSPKVYKDCFLSFLFSSLLNSTPQLWRPAQSVRWKSWIWLCTL